MVKKILATKELSVNIGGVEYDCLLIPRHVFVDMDYSECPDDDPTRKAKTGKWRMKERKEEDSDEQ